MILVDTAVWIDHIRAKDPILSGFLGDGKVLVHSAVIVEIALGHLRHRELTVALLQALPQATIATDEEVMHLINTHASMGHGIGYVDIHLLASARLDGSTVWTRDKRLRAAAQEMGVDADL